jgi:hypothetical protein
MHNDTQHKDTQHNYTQHDDTQHNDTQHNNDIQHNNEWNATLSITTLDIMILNTEHCYAECHLCWVLQISTYAECRYAEGRGARKRFL